MKTVMRAALVAAAMGLPLSAASDDEGDIKYRQAVMKSVSGHAGAIAQIAKGKVSHVDALVAHAEALADVTAMVPAAFKNQAGVGDASDAKAEIWSDWAGFESRAKDLHDAALAVAEAAESGPDAAGAKLEALFDACKACHKDYRVKRN